MYVPAGTLLMTYRPSSPVTVPSRELTIVMLTPDTGVLEPESVTTPATRPCARAAPAVESRIKSAEAKFVAARVVTDAALYTIDLQTGSRDRLAVRPGRVRGEVNKRGEATFGHGGTQGIYGMPGLVVTE